MGRAERTKREERRHLDAFLSNGGWGTAVTSIEDRESPDFIVTQGNGERCGVELRQLFADESASRGSGMRREERRRAGWLRDVCARYYELGGLPASVNVVVRLGFDERLAARLLDRLLTVVPQLDASARVREKLEIVDESEELLAWVFVLRLPLEEQYTRWILYNNQIGWRGSISGADCQARVDAKAALLPLYKAQVDRVRLLLVADGTRPSGMLHREQVDIDPRGFESVHVLYAPAGDVVRLA